MCVKTAHSAHREVVCIYPDRTFVAVELHCGCITLRPVQAGDLERLAVLGPVEDAQSGGDEPADLPLAA